MVVLWSLSTDVTHTNLKKEQQKGGKGCGQLLHFLLFSVGNLLHFIVGSISLVYWFLSHYSRIRTHRTYRVCTTYYKLAKRSVSNINHFKGQMKSKWGSFLKYLCSLMFLWVFIPELCGESWNENKKSSKKNPDVLLIYMHVGQGVIPYRNSCIVV